MSEPFTGFLFPDGNDTLEQAARSLENAAAALADAEREMTDLEAQHAGLLASIREALAAADRLASERNTWKLRAGELETDRNRWRHEAEENARLLRLARGRAVDLAAAQDRIYCPNCGSPDVEIWPADSAAILRCGECGYKEEAIP